MSHHGSLWSAARLRHLFLALFLLLVATGCGLCERVDHRAVASASTTQQLVEAVPARANSVIVVPDWKNLRDLLQVFNQRFGQKIPVEAGLAELKRKYGVDLLDTAAVQQLGVRPSGGLALARVDRSRVLVLALEAPKTFEASLSQIARERWGAAEQPITKQVGQDSLTFWIKKDQQEVNEGSLLMGYAIKDKRAFLFPGRELMANYGDAEVVLGEMLRVSPESSLASKLSVDEVRKQLSPMDSVLVLVDSASEVRDRAKALGEFSYGKEDAARLNQVADDLGIFALGVKASPEAIELRGFQVMKGELLQSVTRASKARADFAPLAQTLSRRAVLAARLSLEPKEALALALSLMESSDRTELKEQLEGFSQRVEMDLEKELLPTLDGNVLISVYDISPLMLQTGNMLDLIEGTEAAVALGVKDRAALAGHLDKLAGGVLVTREDKEGGVTLYSLGSSLRLALGKAHLVVGGSKLKPEELLAMARLEGKPHAQISTMGLDKAHGALAPLKGEQGGWVILDPEQLQQSLGALAGGATPILEPFEAVSLLAQVTQEGGQLDLKLTFKKAGQGTQEAPKP